VPILLLLQPSVCLSRQPRSISRHRSRRNPPPVRLTLRSARTKLLPRLQHLLAALAALANELASSDPSCCFFALRIIDFHCSSGLLPYHAIVSNVNCRSLSHGGLRCVLWRARETLRSPSPLHSVPSSRVSSKRVARILHGRACRCFTCARLPTTLSFDSHCLRAGSRERRRAATAQRPYCLHQFKRQQQKAGGAGWRNIHSTEMATAKAAGTKLKRESSSSSSSSDSDDEISRRLRPQRRTRTPLR
jgi:hypothetical protein